MSRGQFVEHNHGYLLTDEDYVRKLMCLSDLENFTGLFSYGTVVNPLYS